MEEIFVNSSSEDIRGIVERFNMDFRICGYEDTLETLREISWIVLTKTKKAGDLTKRKNSTAGQSSSIFWQQISQNKPRTNYF